MGNSFTDTLQMIELPTVTIDIYGAKRWKLPNGDFHNASGPAIENILGTKEWWINGKRHREDGPAIDFSSGSKEWWIDGKFIYRESSND